MVKDVEGAERMSIWRLAEILDFLAAEKDMLDEQMSKQKNKIKK